jgi:hypothetical protein
MGLAVILIFVLILLIQEGICARSVAKLEDRHLVIVLYCLFYCFRRGSDISIRALFMNLHISVLWQQHGESIYMEENPCTYPIFIPSSDPLFLYLLWHSRLANPQTLVFSFSHRSSTNYFPYRLVISLPVITCNAR